MTDPSSAAPHPLIGTVLRGTYEVRRVVDRGGMGIVFEAEQVRLHRKVAIKILPVHLVQEPKALLRFQREAELVSLLQHPHVVQIFDFDVTEQGEPYLVMEFLQGESLEVFLAREPGLPLALAMRVASQVASGLASVHQALIVHRDLKPANIFLTELPGEGIHIKLLDFGLGKRKGGEQRLTGENDVMGTPDYMPPEQAQGRTANVDQRGDQYSLAVIVYEMLAGRGPYQGDVMEVLEQVIAHEAPPIEDWVPSLPAGVGPVLRRAMAKAPDQRFDTVMEFANALSAAAAPPPPQLSLCNGNATPCQSSDPGGFGTERHVHSSTESAGKSGQPRALSPVPSTSAQLRLLRSLEDAKKARSARDIDVAAKLVERAMGIADVHGSREALAALEREEALIEGSLEMRLGDRGRPLRLLRQPDVRASLLPEEAFLLSRIDGVASAEEVLDTSPMPRLRTLRLLVRMLRYKLISNE
ncbi:MAG TPA: serine/threonine-protein kinase [Polyangiaceae bacterium]|nr:serine/threonine-protein kinase [Polyangiaceae bacterium]